MAANENEAVTAHRYRVLDVFTERPLEGNPLAVFPDGAALSDDTMQRIARELNLSETAFVVPPTRPECAFGVRIFTPKSELRFAGHPTIGTAFVLLDEELLPKGTGSFALDEQVGAVDIRVERNEGSTRALIWLRTPPIEFGPTYDRESCADALGLPPSELFEIPPQIVGAGNRFLYVALRDRAAVDRATYDLGSARKLIRVEDRGVGVFVFAPAPNGAYSRMFAPEHGVAEDAATGSAMGPFAAYMMRHGLVSSAAETRFVSEQGAAMGRPSYLHVVIHGESGSDGIEVGGAVTPLVHATMTLD